MRHPLSIRGKSWPCRWAAVIVLGLAAATIAGAQDTAAAAGNAVVLDSVVAVVNHQPILASDVDDEIRLAVLDPGQEEVATLSRPRALEQLISRTLIQQQIHQEDAQAAEPSSTEIATRMAEIRQEVPACVRFNCASEAGWEAFLVTRGLTPERVESYLRYRIEILRFIEMRFRQGIRISPEEIETYYSKTLLPQYPKGETVPPLSQVSSRIEEILLERQVNALFDDWLKNLRQQGNIEVLDPSLEVSTATDKTEGGDA